MNEGLDQTRDTSIENENQNTPDNTEDLVQKLQKQVDNKEFMLRKRQSDFDKLSEINKQLEDRLSKLEKVDLKKPSRDDYDDEERFVDDLVDWKIKSSGEKENIEDIVARKLMQQQAIEEQNKNAVRFNEEAAKIKKEFPDYWDVVNSESMNNIFTLVLPYYPARRRRRYYNKLMEDKFIVYPSFRRAAKAFSALYEYGRKIEVLRKE